MLLNRLRASSASHTATLLLCILYCALLHTRYNSATTLMQTAMFIGIHVMLYCTLAYASSLASLRACLALVVALSKVSIYIHIAVAQAS
jgi:hypothetical protein